MGLKDSSCPNCGLEDHKWGHYPDGFPISEHPGDAEINKYHDYWMSLANAEQQEVYEAIKDAKVFDNFQKMARPKNSEDAIVKAIEWWMKYYPYEVKEFEMYVEKQRQILANAKGFSTDKDKAMMLEGSIPRTVKKLLELIDPMFFATNPSTGKSPGSRKFYQIYTKARIGGLH